MADSVSKRETKSTAAAKSPGRKADGENVLEGVVKETTTGSRQVHRIPVSRFLSLES